MSNSRSIAIKNQFDRYKRIKNSNKNLSQREFALSSKTGDPRYETFETKLESDEESLILRFDVKRDMLRSLHIQLFCKDIQEDPCYRFESCGSPHTNKKGLLRNRRVPTPHFHEYDESGHIVAYQTNELLDAGKDLLKSREDVLSHFCDTHTIKHNSDIVILPATLFPPDDIIDDRLKGVPFNV